MKKTKLLMPLTGVAALAAVTPVVMTATACNNQDASIAKIDAIPNKNTWKVGDIITKNDIKVTVIFKDESKDPLVVTDWTCDEIGDKGYTFTIPGNKVFTITYKGVQTSVSVACEEAPDATIKNIEASVEWAATYMGTTITKNDIKVIAHMVSGVDEDVYDWTCDEIGDSGYTFKEKGWKAFDIAYKGHHTSLEIYAAAPATLMVGSLSGIVYDSGTNFVTAQKLHIYATSQQQPELHEVDLSMLKVECNPYVKYDETTGTLIPLSGTHSGAIKVSFKDYPDIYVTKDVGILDSTQAGFTGGVDASGNAYITPTTLTGTDTSIIVPEYVVNDSKLVSVTHLVKGDDAPSGIETIVMPKTISNIQANLFSNNDLRNVVFNGTTDEWNAITVGNNWAGASCMGGYCIGQDEPEFVYFNGCQGSTYNSDDKYFMTEKAVGRADLIAGHYTVEFDLLEAYMAGITDLTELKKFSKIELINSSTLSAIGSLAIESIYVDGVELDNTDDYAEGDNKTRYLHDYSFVTGTSGKGVDRFTATSRIIIKFQTPATSLRSVNVKLSYVE